MPGYYNKRFVTEDLRVVQVDGTVISEGRGLGWYLTDAVAWMYADRHDIDGPEVELSDADWEELNEIVNNLGDDYWFDSDPY